jgi:hypothetical protein
MEPCLQPERATRDRTGRRSRTRGRQGGRRGASGEVGADGRRKRYVTPPPLPFERRSRGSRRSVGSASVTERQPRGRGATDLVGGAGDCLAHVAFNTAARSLCGWRIHQAAPALSARPARRCRGRLREHNATLPSATVNFQGRSARARGSVTAAPVARPHPGDGSLARLAGGPPDVAGLTG